MTPGEDQNTTFLLSILSKVMVAKSLLISRNTRSNPEKGHMACVNYKYKVKSSFLIAQTAREGRFSFFFSLGYFHTRQTKRESQEGLTGMSVKPNIII